MNVANVVNKWGAMTAPFAKAERTGSQWIAVRGREILG